MTRTSGRAPELEISRREPAVVAIVHPHDAARMLYVENLLFRTPYRVIEAANGRDAVERIRRHRPKVVVLPSRLPDVDPWAAIRALKREPSTRDVRVLVLASHEDPREREQASAAGADELIVEPTMPSDLVVFVERAVGSAARRRSLPG